MKKLTLIASILFSVCCIAQKKEVDVSLAKEIRKKFNYDSLAFLSCLNTPAGIYAIKFKVNESGIFFDFVALTDSFKHLNFLFIDAIRKSNNQISVRKMQQGTYLQIIYFNNIVSCNPSRKGNDSLETFVQDTSIVLPTNYNKEIIQILSVQLNSLENSISILQQAEWNDEQMIVLPPVLINNQNPNAKESKAGFRNDNDMKGSLSTKQNEQFKRMTIDAQKKAKHQ